MKRVDLLFPLALAVLATFVGVEAFSTRQAQFARHHTGATTVTVTSTGASVQPDDSAPAPVGERRRGLDRDVAAGDVKRRLELAAPGTFIGEVLSAHDSSLARWPDRRTQPLRVWIQPLARIRDWSPASVPIVRDAFIEWVDTGIPLNFTFVLDSASADVHVTFIDHFAEPISGKTLWAHDDRWWILDANIVLAVHHRSGEALDTAAVRAISLHEVGHLIGLDHTSDSSSIMTPRVRVSHLSPVDRATAQLLYMLPPGPIGGTRVLKP
jgi:hypothetical protein